MSTQKNDKKQTTEKKIKSIVEKIEPNITDMVSLDLPTNLKISPEGDKVAYSFKYTNWNKNWYESRVFIYYINKDKTIQLTRTGLIADMRWINNDSIAILKRNLDDGNSKNQIYIYENLIGDPWKATDHKEGVISFRKFANGIVFKANDPERLEKKKRKEEFGSIVHFEQEKSANALYYVNLEKMKEYQHDLAKYVGDESKKLIEPIIELSKLLDEPLNIKNFIPSKQNDAIYFNCQAHDDIVHYKDTSHYVIKTNPDKALETYIQRKQEDKKEDKPKKEEEEKEDEKEDFSYFGTITQFGFPKEGYNIVDVSPDGTQLIITHKERDQMFYTQNDLWVLDIKKWKNLIADEKIIEKLQKITGKLDRQVYFGIWSKPGIMTATPDGTKSALVRILPNGDVKKISTGNIFPYPYGYDMNDNGQVVLTGLSNKKIHEVYVSTNTIASDKLELKQITKINKVAKKWNLGTAETIRWKSKDGTEIEGILRKPSDFDPKKKYPLVFIIHGGPASYNSESLLEYVDLVYYPAAQFSNKGILVVKVNYRGSTGRGQEFLELNKENLGVGDLWDIESCIDYLDKQGFINTKKIGCMGWSQGGYISAFVGIHSKRFKAVSVGAGIADWYTYHISNDIPQFTTHYLSGSPFRDRTLYDKTAPISKIKEAQTPMLIQHGEVDRRVPLSNATELYRGLQEMNIHVELFVYPGMGHPITKPRENRAIMHQNLTWFSHYLLGEELDFAVD
jgi:dipeptidyl aminopeptidase/acylaminoacyl peptidase